MVEFIAALGWVVLAEMGDKTQLLAMAMATKYKVGKVMLGVLIATVLNHGLAVAAGAFLGDLIPLGIVKIVAAVAFLLFGLWTLRGDKLDEEKEDKKKIKFGPVVTVAIAFFIAEMGDKTQLMTIALAAKSDSPVFTLMGTTAGMLVADAIGILLGAIMAKYIPDKYIKWTAGIIFMIFGTLTLYGAAPEWLINPVFIVIYFVLLAVLVYIAGVKFAYKDNGLTKCVEDEVESE